MKNICEIDFLDVDENKGYVDLINKVLSKCFEIEALDNTNLYVEVTLTNPENIRKYNKEFRNIDKETDVLSFPMFEKDEIEMAKKEEIEDALGSIVVSLERVKEQAEEYGHSFERELSYMIVHGFYHLMGEDHMQEDEKEHMRAKEEVVLKSLNINRE